MHYQYVVILKRDSEHATNVLSFLLCLLSVVFFLYSAVSSIGGNQGLAYFHTGISIILIIGLIISLLSRRAGRTQTRYRYLLLAAALGWFASPLPWLAALFILLAFLEYQTKRPLEIGFDSDRVVINTLIRRRYDWSAFSNIVLRDGLLTIDFKNNRLLQKEVVDDPEDDDDADEKEFNDYCQARLLDASQK
ncbi:MAG: hypothetical protein J0H74_23145 [Chitinophagaceae bacterium]|nr:hypothetical protein [Chitinophagaceae bacterium]